MSSWSPGSMRAYLTLLDRHGAAANAARADRLIAEGVGHFEVMLQLSAAEGGAPDDERHLHAARTDAYAAVHGLRGWYRHTGRDGRIRVAVNRLRTSADGEVGRHFVHDASMGGHHVVDRDTGLVVARSPERVAAYEWVARAEGTPLPEPEKSSVPDDHWSLRSIETVDVFGAVA